MLFRSMAPTVLALIASLAHWWPLTPRLFLFAVPAVVLALASGLAAISKAAPRKARTPLLVGLSLVQIGLMARGFPRSLELSAARFVALPDALRYVGARVGDSSTVYFSRDLSVACAYYHTWHPDRHELRGIPSAKDCSLRDVRTVTGRWTTSLNFPSGSAAEVDSAWQEFTEAEGRRILAGPASADLWVVIGPSRLQQLVPSWLEANGATQLAEQNMRGLRILQYRLR